MTDAEKSLLDLVMRRERIELASAEELAAMRKVAAERVPVDYEAKLRAAVLAELNATRHLRELGGQHPLIAYGREGRIEKLKSELG